MQEIKFPLQEWHIWLFCILISKSLKNIVHGIGSFIGSFIGSYSSYRMKIFRKSLINGLDHGDPMNFVFYCFIMVNFYCKLSSKKTSKIKHLDTIQHNGNTTPLA
ncbi:hypothetical protein CKC_05805 [Candidatus Liberibacter solanacearum CLso-ZC1]|uniref:Uncharacterized protein n=1 Tax=Liberibacter solanacearum (strain CLso-ZC1) TaxID=658172 RepID=E4UE78_LIBSC|nr:hypothetical protein CKC_05805 [Candidatus Liberibacter solanacearum CLso-ZC1]